VGFYEGKKLKFAGRVGTGFSEKLLRTLFTELNKIRVDKCPFFNLPAVGRNRWDQGLTAAANVPGKHVSAAIRLDVSGVSIAAFAFLIGRLLRNLLYVQRSLLIPAARICAIPDDSSPNPHNEINPNATSDDRSQNCRASSDSSAISNRLRRGIRILTMVPRPTSLPTSSRKEQTLLLPTRKPY
jgi:hypothetical protein